MHIFDRGHIKFCSSARDLKDNPENSCYKYTLYYNTEEYKYKILKYENGKWSEKIATNEDVKNFAKERGLRYFETEHELISYIKQTNIQIND